MIGQSWMKWTLLEAATKTASKVLQKIVGNVSAAWSDTFLATAVIGCVQTIAGIVVTRKKRIALFADKASIVGSCLFGALAVVSTILSFGAFLYGGDIGVNTFIITLAIVPGALIDEIFFNHKLFRREWCGVGVAVLAGYVVLGAPSLSEFLRMPAWVWMSFGNMMTVAINQGITQKVKKVDPFVKNFWGGLTTLMLCAVLLAVGGLNHLPTSKLLLVSGIIGVIVVGMWAFNLLSYKAGASIALKKLVMNGSYLTAAMVCGVVFFREEITVGKCVGVILYFVAFVLMDKETWRICASVGKPVKV